MTLKVVQDRLVFMILRQKELFKKIVEEYIKTAQPVGSKLAVEKFNLDVS